MKKKIFIPVVLACCVSFGLLTTFSIQKNKQPVVASAASLSNPKTSNFGTYTYSGTYYDNLGNDLTTGLDGTLRTSLSSLIKPSSTPTYSGSGNSTSLLSGALQYADADPDDSDNMIFFYTRDSVVKQGAGTWNREHVWPKSLSNDCWGTTGGGSDLLHIRPTYESTNSARGNKLYGDVEGTYLQYNDMDYGKISGNYFEPIPACKGDTARIIMYVWVAHKLTYPTKLPEITNVFKDYDTMMRWHIADAPDRLEGNRNDYAQSSMQRNRNPFVDHPEYAWQIFGEKCSESVLELAKQTYPAANEIDDGDDGDDTPIISAKPWADKFLQKTGEICDPEGKNTDLSSLYTVWMEMRDEYLLLSQELQARLINPQTIIDEEEKAACIAAKERHDFISNKYQGLPKIISTSSQTNALLKEENNDYLYTILILSSLIITAFIPRTIYTTITKRKRSS